MEARFTCITCRVAFHDAEIQREHYKTDWHRYNLKRKVAELPPVTVDEFARRALLQREKDEETSHQTSAYCAICKKPFNTQNAYNNHLNSKRHKQLEQVGLAQEEEEEESDSALQEKGPPKGNGKVDVESDGETDSDVEEVDSDEWEAESGDNPIAHNNCLFCPNHSASMTRNLKHMSVAHSFFIPDTEYVVDMKGLLMYLGEKVSQFYVCLWCNEKGRAFYSMESAQQHMVDKGHCKMLHEGETLAEYADYYDYSASYPDHAVGIDPDEEVNVNVLDDSEYELVLPSGAKIGHRSLMRYYRQNLDPSKGAVVVRKQQKLHRVLAQYKALGWTETQKEQAVRKARDLHFMRRAQAKFSVGVGVRANKLQKHFRKQVVF